MKITVKLTEKINNSGAQQFADNVVNKTKKYANEIYSATQKLSSDIASSDEFVKIKNTIENFDVKDNLTKAKNYTQKLMEEISQTAEDIGDEIMQSKAVQNTINGYNSAKAKVVDIISKIKG